MSNQNSIVASEGEGARAKPLTPGQLLNDAKFDMHPFKDPSKRYVIFSSQRTGSNYLCRRLCNVEGQFGMPSEYLNPVNVNMLVPRLLPNYGGNKPLDVSRYLRALQRARTTADGYFGIKIQPQQLIKTSQQNNAEFAIKFLDNFDRIVLLTRKDKLGQAISGAIAAVTGKWFNDEKEAELTDAEIQRLYPLIANNLGRYLAEENLILDVGRKIKKPVLRIQYEEIAADGDRAFSTLTDFLLAGAETPVKEDDSLTDVPEKPEGKLAMRVRERFIQFLKNE